MSAYKNSSHEFVTPLDLSEPVLPDLISLVLPNLNTKWNLKFAWMNSIKLQLLKSHSSKREREREMIIVSDFSVITCLAELIMIYILYLVYPLVHLVRWHQFRNTVYQRLLNGVNVVRLFLIECLLCLLSDKVWCG